MRISICRKNYNTTERFKKIVILAAVIALMVSYSNLATAQGKIAEEPIVIEEIVVIEDASQPLKEVAIIQIPEPTPIEIVVLQKPSFKILTKSQMVNMNLKEPSNLTDEQAEEIIKDSGLKGLGSSFVEAENLYGINALYLISHAALESQWGKSTLSNIKNNIFGFAAYDKSPIKSSTHFDTKRKCILYVSEYIARNYLSKDGQHYNGPTLKGMNVKYASDNNWANKIVSIMDSSQKKIEEAELL